MKSFTVKNLAGFLRQLFVEDSFDAFLVPEAVFVTGFTSSFDGRIPPNRTDAEEKEKDASASSPDLYISWGQLKPLAQALVKGKTLPRSFSLVFTLSEAKTLAFLEAAGDPIPREMLGGLFLNIRYTREQLILTSGCSLRQFTPDRTLEQAWDRQLAGFLARLGAVTDQD